MLMNRLGSARGRKQRWGPEHRRRTVRYGGKMRRDNSYDTTMTCMTPRPQALPNRWSRLNILVTGKCPPSYSNTIHADGTYVDPPGLELLQPIDDFLRADVALPHPLQAVRDRLQPALPHLDGERLHDALLHELGQLLQERGVVVLVLERLGDHHPRLPDELPPERRVQEARYGTPHVMSTPIIASRGDGH